jgi:nicotinamide riboside kinase
MIKIAITGPESCGKSTLAQWLKTHLADSIDVNEFARDFLSQKTVGYRYNAQDFLQIIEGQKECFANAFQTKASVLIADTDPYVLEVWSQEVFGRVFSEIKEMKEMVQFDIHLLCAPDIAWQYDPLRENPTDRERLFNRYENILKGDKKLFEVITGEGEDRNINAMKVLVKHWPLKTAQ